MPGFGENLRREREMRGVTLEEIAESTKISTRFLKAVEEDRFSELPGGVFTRSFIRSYAQYLGLDEEHVLSEYKRAAQPASDNDLGRFAAAKPLAPKSGARARVAPWVVAAVIFALGYALYRYSVRTTELPRASAPPPAVSSASSTSPANSLKMSPASSPSTPASPNPSATAPAPGSTPNPGSQSPAPGVGNPAATGNQQGSAEQPVSSTSGAVSAEPAPASAIGDGDLLLQVATTDEVWLAVQADGKTVLQRVLPPNSVQTFRAKDSFDVTTGDAQATILTLNGATQKPLGRHGEFKKIHLARADFGKSAP